MSDLSTGTQQPNPYAPQQKYQYTEDELRVLKECRSESFWYRCVPFALGGVLLSRFLISRGILTTKRGPAPKILFAGMGGYFIGKLSYIKTCNNKILALENSPMAEAIREGMRAKKLGLPPPPHPGAMQRAPQAAYGVEANPSESFRGVQIIEDQPYQSDDAHSNMDIDTSNVKRIDDYQEQLQDEVPLDEKSKMTTTYDELRQQSRSTRPIYHSQYAPQQAPPQAQPQGQWNPQSQSPPPAPARHPVQQKKSADGEFPLGRSRKNKYGDEWSE